MRQSNRKPFLAYLGAVIAILAGMSFVLFPLLNQTERIIGSIVFVCATIMFAMLIYNIFEKYIKPAQLAAKVAEELVEGNLKARTYISYLGEAGRLSNSINVLARNMQEKLQQEKMQETQLRTVMDNMESGLIMIDERGYIHLANRKALDIFDTLPNDMIGSVYHDVISVDIIHQAVQKVFLYEETVRDSFIIASGKEQKFIEIVGAPIFNEKADLKGAVLVFHDITELKRLENTRKEFVANVSHELKTPITSIRGFAETLLEGAMHDEQLREQFLQIILTEGERLQALIDDLLQLSRLEKEGLHLYKQVVDLSLLVDQIIPLINQQAEKKDIKLNVRVAKSVRITADENRLKQVFLNLMNNAVNYTPDHGQVSLIVEEDEQKIKLTVKDTGIGISKEAQKRIFERFYRVDKARSRSTGGTGLGLAIVKHIVEAHHGTIEVKSKVNEGSAFIITLPKE